MVLLLLGCVLFFLGVTAILTGQSAKKGQAADLSQSGTSLTASAAPIVGAALVLLALALTASAFFHPVPTGHTGVVTVFGHVENYTLDSGPHLIAPWKTVITMDNRVQKQTLNLSCFSSDLQEVSMSYTVNYQIRKADAMTLYSTVGTSYYDTVIAPGIAEAVKVATAKYTAENLIGMRAELAAMIEDLLSESLSRYNIEVVGTSIEDMDFTDAFTDAVEKKQVAQQDKLRAQTESEQKEIEAAAAANIRKIEADAEAYETSVRAQAEAEANQKIAASLTPELVEYLQAQKWNGELPMITGGSTPIINAGDILR